MTDPTNPTKVFHGGSWNADKHWKKLRAKHNSGRKFIPEVHQSAGKGSTERPADIPKEIYALNYQLAFGKITKRQHTARVNKFWREQE
jgi:hypothetical protein